MTDDKAMAGGTCNILKFSDTNSNMGKFQALAVKKLGHFCLILSMMQKNHFRNQQPTRDANCQEATNNNDDSKPLYAFDMPIKQNEIFCSVQSKHQILRQNQNLRIAKLFISKLGNLSYSSLP